MRLFINSFIKPSNPRVSLYENNTVNVTTLTYYTLANLIYLVVRKDKNATRKTNAMG